jgi:hypothetical protein
LEATIKGTLGNPATDPSFSQIRRLGGLLLCVGVALLGPDLLAGQSIHGRVLVQGDTIAIPGVDLALSDSSGAPILRAQADDEGAFRLPAPRPGLFRIRVSRIGYATLQVEVQVLENETVVGEVRLATEAIPLEPLIVVGRREIRMGTLDEFYDRMARNKNRGKGRFLTKEQIEDRISMSLPMLLQTLPGVWLDVGGQSVRLLNSGGSGGTFCTPEYFLDGRPMLGGYRTILTMDLEGVEVYRGYSEAVHGHFPNQCGMVFLWRRRDWGNPFSWSRLFMAGGFTVLAFAIALIL